MSVTRLSDVIIPELFLEYGEVNTPERIAFLQSGVVNTDPVLDAAANRGGQLTIMPFWNDLDASGEPNISTDNPSDLATPDKVTAGEMQVRICDYNKSWSAADLAGLLAGSEPMRRIRERTDYYWSRIWQHKLIAVCEGVRKANIASNAADMVYDVSLQSAGTVADANLFSRPNFTSAAFTMGDRFDDVVAIAIHSRVAKKMTDEQLIDFVQPAGVPLPVPMYDNKYVIVDDGLPMITDTNNANVFKFVSVLFGRGVIGFGNGTPQVPVETFRWPAQGNGAGVEELYLRKRWIVHPNGYTFTSASVAGQSPTNTELSTAANWTRVVPRKNVPMAFLITNG